ncbi:hypothetical protein O181_052102 [Austropuccinia psidii MF-1]|uniref:Integrase zinc-binding domain-containing protein n=1 Tax=Austropuccinia psidii MF-1 TaxID=1389203 RepID=A0A9Q3E6Y9_9BASI|nr:hypothetical protein [Austropuccinia psidii MF-1]
MSMVHEAGNIRKTSDGLSGWELTNTPKNPCYVPENEEPQILIGGITITDVETEFFEEAIESYKQDKNCHILISVIDKHCKDAYLANSSDYIWKLSYDNGRFYSLYGILYHRSKHTCVMVLYIRMLINTILLEYHDNIYYGKLSDNRTMERIHTCYWWPSWLKMSLNTAIVVTGAKCQ